MDVALLLFQIARYAYTKSESDYQEDLLKNPKLMCVRIFYCSNAIIASASADVFNLSNLIMCYLKYASLKFVLRPKYFLEAIASLYSL